jgi:hypothetical protein
MKVSHLECQSHIIKKSNNVLYFVFTSPILLSKPLEYKFEIIFKTMVFYQWNFLMMFF